ncbi:MAG: hypothetical protein ABIQ31_04290 [Ferruginibacter sp.]
MKKILTATTILFITNNSLSTQDTKLPQASTRKEFSTVPGNLAPAHIMLEEPVGVLNQAGNIFLPALKMFQ